MGDEVQRASRIIAVPASIGIVALLSPRDAFLRVLEDRLVVSIHVRDSQMTITGEPRDAASAVKILTELITIIHTGQGLSEETVERTINLATEDLKPSEILTADIISAHSRTVRLKILNQKRYVDAINWHTVVFEIGPTGTGKTYLVMAKVIQALQPKQMSCTILTRPVIGAGERLGFLPGTLSGKIDPYLWLLYDALHDMVEVDSVPKLPTSGTIEVAPLTYMRGYVLNSALITLNGTQSTSSKQMRTFPTRLGFGSRVVVTGDITQIDPPGRAHNGLRQVAQVLDGVKGIAFCTLATRDVVRHKPVGRIITAYDSYNSIQQGKGGR